MRKIFHQDFQTLLHSFQYGKETEEILGFREGHGGLPVSDCQVSICTGVLDALYRRHLVSLLMVVILPGKQSAREEKTLRFSIDPARAPFLLGRCPNKKEKKERIRSGSIRESQLCSR